MFENPFNGFEIDVAPENYAIRHYRHELIEIRRIYKCALKELPESIPVEVPENENGEGMTTPNKTLAAQRSQAMGAASKRLSRGVAVRFLVECKQRGFPMTVHLGTMLLADLFNNIGRSGISETLLVKFAGGGPGARRHAKLDLDKARKNIIKSGLIAKHREILAESKAEAAEIRAAFKRA